MGALDYLDAPPRVRGDAGQVAGDQPELLTAIQQVFQDLAADVTDGCGDDDHRSSLVFELRIAMLHYNLTSAIQYW